MTLPHGHPKKGFKVASRYETEKILSVYSPYAGLAAYYLIFARMPHSGKI
jgi:hypothetical protein